MAAILDFTLKIYVPLNTFWYIFKILLPDDLENQIKRVSKLLQFVSGDPIICHRLLLFTLYTTPLRKIISRHNVCHHLYADDTQIYIILSRSEPEMALALLQDCLFDVGDWMRSSKLKLSSS